MQEQPHRPEGLSYRRRAGRRGRPPADASAIKEYASREAADILWRAVTEAETVLANAARELLRPRPPDTTPPPPADLEEAVRLISDRFGRVVDQLSEERRLLSEHVDFLGKAVERLDTQLQDLGRAVADLREARSAQPTPTGPVAPPAEVEPRFAAGGEGVHLVITHVADFHDLMDLQGALSSMPAIERAAVEGYLDGEARLILHLREPVTATRLAEGLRETTGQVVAVEDARPEALRLRLRLGDAP